MNAHRMPRRTLSDLPHWVLRAGLLLSSTSYIVWMAKVDETPLLGWLWSPGDVGGLGLGETTAMGVQRAIALALGLAALLLVWRPWRVLLAAIFLFQFVWATAMSQKLEGYPLDLVAWDDTPLAFLGAWLPSLFPYATEAARVVAPLVLWRMVVARQADPTGWGRSPSAEWLARGGVALTFAAHGIEALLHYPAFVDMLIISFANLGFPTLSEGAAKGALTAIGTIDLGLAVGVLFTRWPPIVAYMAFWGFTTAMARVVMRGWELGGIDAAVRTAHFALPLVLLIWWYQTRRVPTGAPPVPSLDSA